MKNGKEAAAKRSQRLIGRRALFLLLAAHPVIANPKLGGVEWMAHFREFIKSFNAFVEALDDSKLDLAKWEGMRTAWKAIDIQQ